VESADAIRTKKISATELLALTFQRIDFHNPAINAIVWQCREHAMERARQADEALAHGETWGPLHGVPVTIKEASTRSADRAATTRKPGVGACPPRVTSGSRIPGLAM
jgi:amidase